MANGLEVHSYVGVGDIQFGMRPVEVEQLLGPPARARKGFLGERVEYRRDNGLLATYPEDSRLVELGFSRNITDLKFDGKELFTRPSLIVLKELLEQDGKPYESVGFIVLLTLGMTLTGFHDGNRSQKAVTVFVKGRWDDELANLKPFDLEAFLSTSQPE